MPLNPKAAEFKPRCEYRDQIPAPMSGPDGATATKPVPIPLPDDPFSQDFDDIAISPEEAEELENVQNWVELMADFEQSEGEHLIAMAMKYADKKRLQDLKHR